MIYFIRFEFFFHFFKNNTARSVFKKLEFRPFDLEDIILGNTNDPHDIFNTHRFSGMSYFTTGEPKLELSGSYCNSSILILGVFK